MPVLHRDTHRSALRLALFRLRQRLPEGLRLRVWRQTATAVMRRQAAGGKQPLFRSLELETRTRCNSTCTFCAASIQNDQRPDIRMPDATYLKIVEELAALDYRGALKFFVNNEPLLDARTADFIRIAKERIPGVRTEVHTNGLKLNPRSGRELLEAGLDLLHINNYCNDGKLHRGVEAFLNETAVDFPDRKIVCQIRLLDERLLNRGGTAPNAQPEASPLSLPCVLPFDEMVLTADGRVTICCQDHDFAHSLGNVNAQSLQEIWHGEGFERLRVHLRQGLRSAHPMCKVCDFRGYKQEHMTATEAAKNRMVGDLLHG